MGLTDEEIERYSRQILLPEVGGAGQERLKQARVLVVGAGGLGCPVLQYLVGGGVGAISVIDDDRIQLSNLQRQVLFETGDIGRSKADVAVARLSKLNAHVALTALNARLCSENLDSLVAEHDLVCDGSDNFETRFATAAVCQRYQRTLVTAAIFRYEAQIAVFPGKRRPEAPCYRCLYPELPPARMANMCSDNGILGAVAGAAGGMQATLALLELMEIPGNRSGQLFLWNACDMTFRTIRLIKDPGCPCCGR